MLYLISTPIGNLDDISYRAVKILKETRVIACEDKLKAINLLKHFEIDNKVKNFIPYHAKNEENASDLALYFLKEEEDVVLISEAGTPLISDPGYLLVKKAIENNIEITHISGSCALISALLCSGFNATEFSYFGYMPKKQGKKTKLIEAMISDKKTSIVYESCYRLIRALEIVEELAPEQNVCVAKEISKMHEEFIRGTATVVKNYFLNKKETIKSTKKTKTKEKVSLKGEFVIVFE